MVPEVQTSDTSVVTWHLVDLSRTQVHFLNHQSATGPGAKPQVQQQEVCLCPKHFDIECSQTPGRVFFSWLWLQVENPLFKMTRDDR